MLPAPCDPTSVSADLDCSSAVVTVTWGASAGAVNYTVLAEAGGQSSITAHTAGTTTELDTLQCGEVLLACPKLGN